MPNDDGTHSSLPHLVIIQSSMIPPSGLSITLRVAPIASVADFVTGREANEAGSTRDKKPKAPGPEYLQYHVSLFATKRRKLVNLTWIGPYD